MSADSQFKIMAVPRLYYMATIDRFEREAAALRADRDALAVVLRAMINDCLDDSAIFRPTLGSIGNAQQALSQHGGNNG